MTLKAGVMPSRFGFEKSDPETSVSVTLANAPQGMTLVTDGSLYSIEWDEEGGTPGEDGNIRATADLLFTVEKSIFAPTVYRVRLNITDITAPLLSELAISSANAGDPAIAITPAFDSRRKEYTLDFDRDAHSSLIALSAVPLRAGTTVQFRTDVTDWGEVPEQITLSSVEWQEPENLYFRASRDGADAETYHVRIEYSWIPDPDTAG